MYIYVIYVYELKKKVVMYFISCVSLYKESLAEFLIITTALSFSCITMTAFHFLVFIVFILLHLALKANFIFKYIKLNLFPILD